MENNQEKPTVSSPASTALLCCPFCGSEAQIIQTEGCDLIAGCTECDAQCGYSSDEEESEVIEAWNKRIDFSTIKGKQLISEKAIEFLFNNHRDIYDEFTELV